MKLNKLSCDQASFKAINFNPEGLTLIIGDKLNAESDEGSSNGVGKTLSLGLVHHCLGASSDPQLAAAVPDWIFCLDFWIGGIPHVIQRSGDGKRIWLDEEPVRIGKLREWLNQRGPFDLSDGIDGLTFRSLVTRFGRLRAQDCEEPIKTSRETPYDSLLRSCFLLGIDISLVVSKHKSKLELDAIEKSKSNWKSDKVLHETFRAGTNPKVRAEWLHGEIKRIDDDLKAFKVAEDYRQIELSAGQLTQKLREIETSQQVVLFQLDGVEQSLNQHPDISKADLLALYSGLGHVFKEEALQHFSAVEAFHAHLVTNRKQRLHQQRIVLGEQLEKLKKDWSKKSIERDALLQSLSGKHALDEYAALARKHASMKEELGRLNEYLTYSDKLQCRIQKIREKRVKEDGISVEYVWTNPLARHATTFQNLVGLLYPATPAGIALDINTGDNQVRYNLSVSIEGDDSDGINAARLIIFDWILAMQGVNHSMGFLWHDNRLFAHIDPLQRARWFEFVCSALKDTGKQYIASLNTENFDAMLPHLSDVAQVELSNNVVVTLRGDEARNKLLGIQFGRRPKT